MTTSGRSNRRRFLQWTGIGAAAAMTVSTRISADDQPTKKSRPLRLALASYTLRKFDLDQTIEMTKRVGLEAICLKSFHLPLELTTDQIKEAATKVRDAGLDLYGGGVIGMKNAEQVDQAFEYAKAAGLTHIVAAPTPEMLPHIDRKVKECDILVCIHNHGPGDTHFPTPAIAYPKIKDFDSRIGLCHDVGHTIRYGRDAIAESKECADRLYDIHIKDVTEATKTGHSTPCGRGIIDLPSLLRTLVKIDFSGYLAFEYEEDPEDPLPGLAESVGYVRGLLDAMS